MRASQVLSEDRRYGNLAKAVMVDGGNAGSMLSVSASHCLTFYWDLRPHPTPLLLFISPFSIILRSGPPPPNVATWIEYLLTT